MERSNNFRKDGDRHGDSHRDKSGNSSGSSNRDGGSSREGSRFGNRDGGSSREVSRFGNRDGGSNREGSRYGNRDGGSSREGSRYGNRDGGSSREGSRERSGEGNRDQYSDNKVRPDKGDLVFGIRPIMEAVNAGRTVEKVLVKKDLDGELYNELFDLLLQHNIPVSKVPIEKLNRVTSSNHQGVVAYMSPIEFAELEDLIPAILETGKVPLVLLLDQVSDVRNFGAIARSAECAGADAIIIPLQGSAQINADALKTSAGALNIIPVCRVKLLKYATLYLQQNGFQVVAATEKADASLYSVDLTIPTAIVMGAEDTGVSNEILKIANKRVKIPLVGKIDSLNVSVAASIMLFEAVRQRSLGSKS
ncbi:23S rRNA (guanosine2251-2'-O)-methyltransferase [Williamwhitmania taraxaci]|uniref:23S rRNA (Guanosine2251-2'-O)-methyltransferase n=1 Tax=Williamwhitmania taraxaci TaxID=1640674 RepID=A0A1G6Q6X4_9BACT|nr:23S rRNA (guanosine2251-2'-O)-methyltransferase [Williamwhitmania taraxaci]